MATLTDTSLQARAMRSLPGFLGVVVGLIGLFVGVQSLVAASGITELSIVAVGLISLGLVLLRVDESLSSRGH